MDGKDQGSSAIGISLIRVGFPGEEGGDGLVRCIEGGVHQWCPPILGVWLQGDRDDDDDIIYSYAVAVIMLMMLRIIEFIIDDEE